MPIYEYECTKCGHRLEALQKVTEAPLVVCPECQGDSLQKLVSSTSFQLKGTGWYATDFKTKAKTDEKKTEKTAPKTDSKPKTGTED